MSRRPRFRKRSFALAALAVIAGHWFALPRMFLPLLERPERPVEVAFIDDEANPPLPPKLDEPPPPGKPLDEERETAQSKKKQRPKPPEPKKVVRRTPPPPPPAPPPPPPPPPPKVAQPLPETPPAHWDPVDQNQFRDEKDNPDAKHLAQKNHRALIDRKALVTNLVKRQAGEATPTTAPSKNEEPKPGQDKEKRAELEDRKEKKRREKQEREQLAQERGVRDRGDEGRQAESRPGKLSMRGLKPAEGALESTPDDHGKQPTDGVRRTFDDPNGPTMRSGQARAAEASGARKRGERARLSLDQEQFDRVVGGAVAQAEREAVRKSETSHSMGRWERLAARQQALRSSLENFDQSSYVGRESELGTRAHPYAAYIAEVHRAIHRRWGESFLPALDGKSPVDPLNDMGRWTSISFVVNGDGSVDKAAIARPSGLLEFDVAAWDAVVNSGPFSPPPEAIRSFDGKVYIDWMFYRDERQCHPAYAVPHILTGDKHSHAEPPPAKAGKSHAMAGHAGGAM